MKKLVFLVTCQFFCLSLLSQFVRGPIGVATSGVLNGVYIPADIPTKKVVPYPHVREADVMWSKRIWSVIDLREKFNHPLYYPMDKLQNNIWNRNISQWSLWTIIRYHILNGELTLYSPFHPEWEEWTDGDEFKYPITSKNPGGNFFNDSAFREQMFVYLGTEEIDPFAVPFKSWLYPDDDSTVIGPDGLPVVVYPPNDTSWFMSQDIIQYRIKEDWFFDKQRSVMDKRIIGIAPVVYEVDNNGNITGLRELFWLYFPECRYIFQNFFLANRHNDAQRMSLDDLFWKRMFHSYVIEESNIYNRKIDSYKAGVDALLESEAIKEKLFELEHDLWSF